MTEITTTQRSGAAEQAKTLLAYAADSRHFYEAYVDDGHQTLHERDAATALYAAQAATAHAMLAVAGELAELRAELRQAAAVREDLAEVAVAVREVATTVAEHMDEQTDQVEAVRDAVEEGLADVIDVIDVVDLLVRPRGGRWARLLWWRRRSAAQVAGELIAKATRANAELPSAVGRCV